MPSEYANDLMARVGLDTTEWKKGITDLNSGIKHIETGFQATAALMDDWSNNSEGLRKRIESLNDKLALQKQKLDLLKKAYEEEVAQNGASSKAAEELAKKMYAAQNEINRTKSSVENYTNKLVEMGDTAGKVADKLDTYAQKTRTLSTVSVAALGAISAALVKAGANADELNTLAKQTGLTVEEIQKFKYASDLIDVELEDMTGSLRKMTRNMISTSSEVKEAWETLGVSTVDANGKSRDAVEVFYDVLEALSKVRNETERDQLAMLIFGKSANDLAGIVDDGGDALRQLGNEAERLGLIMSQDAVDGANEFNDAIDSMKAKVTASLGKAFSENAEELAPAMESLAEAVVSVVEALANMPPWAQKTVVGFLAISSVASPLLSAASKISKVFSAIQKIKLANSLNQTASAMRSTASATRTATTATKGFGTAMKSSLPVIALVIAALAALVDAYDEVKQQMIDDIAKRYDSERESAEKQYNAEIEAINAKIDAAESAQAKSVELAEEEYEACIEAAEDYVETTKKLIDNELKIKKEAHEEALDMIEEEREARKKAIDDATAAANSELQAQIDAIDAQIEVEEKAKKEAENAQKLKELQIAVASAQTMADKRNAEKELAKFIAEQEEAKTLAAKEELKKQLQNQIDANNEKAEAQKDLIDSELDAERQVLEDSYNEYEKNLEEKLERLDTHIDSETENAKVALEKAVAYAKTQYDKDYANFKASLDEKSKAYEDYLADLTQKQENEEEDVEPSASEVFKEAFSGLGASVDSDPKHFAQTYMNLYEPIIKSRIKELQNEGFSYEEAIEKVKTQLAKEFETRGVDVNSFMQEWDRMFPANAKGTNFWKGGPTRINEEGGEILNLPRGTQIIPHDVSMEIARAAGKQSAITNNTTTNNNSYNYGAQQQVTVLEVSGETVATVIQPAMSVGMARETKSRGRALGVASKRV